jgi:undecaprenyl-diphosphatase
MRSPGNWFRESPVVRLIAGLALAALALLALGWLVTGSYKSTVAGFDSNIRHTMRQIQSPMWTALFLTVTKLGSTLYLVIIGTAAGLLLIFYRLFRSLFFFIIAMAGQAVLHHSFKWLFARPRPSNLINYRAPESSGFPSGHAIAALCLFGMIAWIVTREIESPAIKAGIWVFTTVLVFLIGVSRVYIGIHYPTDVLAGFVGGAIWIAAIMSADRKPL